MRFATAPFLVAGRHRGPMQFRCHARGLWLVQVVAPLIYHHCSATEAPTTISGAAWLTTSSPQAMLGSAIRFTCAAPVSWSATFQWYVDDAVVDADQFTPGRPFRVGLRHGEDRALMPEELAYTVLEARAEQPKVGRVSCLVTPNGTRVKQPRMRMSSPYISSDSGRQLHYSHNTTCGRERMCVDGNSSCYADLAAQVRRCLCVRRYPFYSAPRASCLKHYTGLGSHCVNDLDCRAEPNSVCGSTGRCVCAPSYSGEYKLGECVREVGLMGACSAESMCSVEHSHCSANLTCQCYQGRRYDGSKCVTDVRGESLRLRAAFFVLATALCLISLAALVGTAVARAVCQLLPLRHGAQHSRHRRLVVRLL
ncbi:hypothetical protein HPB49_021144 [Dermacentor silvarum]|uniref:Uncharacterized protein n=2 Tax=Dermacentor silvarum TaxID=543639 RepID=A0ACB8DFC1_DERSI|nr:hypothetical protein HPB49_021144 [Dermacentor silvarum]